MKILLFIILTQIYLQCPGEPHCSKCNFENEKCLKCNNSFFNQQSGKCDFELQSIQHCQNYLQQNGQVTCNNCEYGFGLIKEKCSKCKIYKCAICDNNIDECQACQNSIAGTKESCLSEGKYCEEEQCEICNVEDHSQCKKCKVGYSINKNGKCEKGVANCKVLSKDQNKCEECLENYYINSKYECISNIKKIFKQKTKIITFLIFIGLDIFLLIFILIKIRGDKKEIEKDDAVYLNADTEILD